MYIGTSTITLNTAKKKYLLQVINDISKFFVLVLTKRSRVARYDQEYLAVSINKKMFWVYNQYVYELYELSTV